jgi:hypothetical protein
VDLDVDESTGRYRDLLGSGEGQGIARLRLDNVGTGLQRHAEKALLVGGHFCGQVITGQPSDLELCRVGFGVDRPWRAHRTDGSDRDQPFDPTVRGGGAFTGESGQKPSQQDERDRKQEEGPMRVAAPLTGLGDGHALRYGYGFAGGCHPRYAESVAAVFFTAAVQRSRSAGPKRPAGTTTEMDAMTAPD